MRISTPGWRHRSSAWITDEEHALQQYGGVGSNGTVAGRATGREESNADLDDARPNAAHLLQARRLPFHQTKHELTLYAQKNDDGSMRSLEDFTRTATFTVLCVGFHPLSLPLSYMH